MAQTIPNGAYLAMDGKTLIDANGVALSADAQASYTQLAQQRTQTGKQVAKLESQLTTTPDQAIQAEIARVQAEAEQKAQGTIAKAAEQRQAELDAQAEEIGRLQAQLAELSRGKAK